MGNILFTILKLSMNYLEKNDKLESGYEIFYRIWLPDQAPSGVICLVHGLGEHSGRYKNVALKLTFSGYAVIAFDLPGHGKSSGKRGSVKYHILQETIHHGIQKSFRLLPLAPVFLYGHSMGGNLVLHYALNNKTDLAGLICTSPWLRLKKEPSPFLKIIARVLSLFAPGITFSSGIRPADISHDPNQVYDYQSDKLIHNKISVGLFFEIEHSARIIRKSIYKINNPFLLMHGDADKITLPAASQNFVRGSGKKTTFRLWPGAFHELHHEQNSDEVIEYIINWLNSIVVDVPEKAVSNGYF